VAVLHKETHPSIASIACGIIINKNTKNNTSSPFLLRSIRCLFLQLDFQPLQAVTTILTLHSNSIFSTVDLNSQYGFCSEVLSCWLPNIHSGCTKDALAGIDFVGCCWVLITVLASTAWSVLGQCVLPKEAHPTSASIVVSPFHRFISLLVVILLYYWILVPRSTMSMSVDALLADDTCFDARVRQTFKSGHEEIPLGNTA